MVWWQDMQQAIIWTNGGLDYWDIYASLGLVELIYAHILHTFI